MIAHLNNSLNPKAPIYLFMTILILTGLTIGSTFPIAEVIGGPLYQYQYFQPTSSPIQMKQISIYICGHYKNGTEEWCW